MTREEAINKWIIPAINRMWNDKRCKEIIKALEQEPILDKVRAEIELQREEVSKKHSEDEGLSNYYFGLNDGLKDARDVIDKYKAESEV